MPAADRIAALLARDIAQVTQALISSGNVDAWERQMTEAIARGHTAAAIAGTAERLGVEAGTALLNERNLSKVERMGIRAAVAGQLPYLHKFADDIRAGRLSDAQIAARAGLYAGAVRATWGASRWAGAGLPAMPTEGSECLTNCKCEWIQHEDGFHWTLTAAEHCPTCLTRASEWAPYRAAA